jgi:hypothetical protein
MHPSMAIQRTKLRLRTMASLNAAMGHVVVGGRGDVKVREVRMAGSTRWGLGR